MSPGFRTLGLRNAAEASSKEFFTTQDQQYHKSFNAYLKGFNNYMMNGKMPVEFYILGLNREELKPEDSYSIINLFAYGFTMSAIQESVSSYIGYKLGDNYLEDFYFGEQKNNFNIKSEVDTSQIENIISYSNKILSVLDEFNIQPWNASNSWIIGREKSKTGQVILANDTHFAYTEPGAWYEAEISYPGYNFYGLYLPGLPFPVIGHNEKYGWGLTIFPFDNSNYYIEKIDSVNKKVMYKNEWVNLKERDEIIKIKGKEDLPFKVWETPHGPLISNYDEKLKNNIPENISIWWTLNFMKTPVMECLYNLSRAENMAQFEKNLSLIDILGLNVNYGDSDGNIAFWGTGRIPVYNDNINPYTLLDGSSGTMEVDSFYDFSKNPHLINPDEHFIATANNDPTLSGAAYYPGHYLPNNRIKIINKTLASKDMWGIADVEELQLNHFSMRDLNLKNLICENIRDYDKIKNDKFLSETFTIFDKWNGEYDADANAPLIMSKLFYFINKNMMSDELPQDIFEFMSKSYLLSASVERLYSDADSPWWDDIKTKEFVETRKEIFIKSFIETVGQLKTEWGSDVANWKWEEAHQLTFPHFFSQNKLLSRFFDIGPFPMPSCQGCINKMEYASDNAKIHKVNGGPAMRNIVDFSDVGNSLGILPTGQSGCQGSKFYDDQSELFTKGIYRNMIFKDTSVVNSKNVMILEPKS